MEPSASSLELQESFGLEIARRLLDARLRRELLLPAPGAGLDFQVPVPSGVYWELLSFSGTFVTSAVVGSRRVSIRPVTADAVTVTAIEANATQAASVSLRYSFTSGMGSYYGGSGIGIPLPTPPILLSPGWQLRTVTGTLDVGDAWSAAMLIVREVAIAEIEDISRDIVRSWQ